MKLGKIIDAIPSLQKISSAELPLKTLYKVSKMMKTLEDEISFFENQRNTIIQKYSDKGGKLTDEKAVIDEVTKLLDLEVETEIIPVELSAEEDIKLSVNDVRALDGFIEIKFEQG